MRPVRRLTEPGTKRFRSYIESVRNKRDAGPAPFELLADDSASAPIESSVTVDQDRHFLDSFDLGTYLVRRLGPVAEEQLQDFGIWNWLALCYFDQLCPPSEGGTRKPNANHRYLFSEDYRHRYRHLLATPYRLVYLHGDNARALLKHAISVHSDLTEQLAARQEIMTNEGLMKAVDLLYFDEARGGPKTNAANRGYPGSARRLIAVAQQLDLTYDLYAMTGSEIVGILPPEFDSWKP